MPKDNSNRPPESVAVLMSTYNGAKHIYDQIESIVVQLGPQDSLIIRDDGSSDATIEIIESFNDPRIKIIPGYNIGFAQSFLWLLHHAERRHSIYMLADQDDIWQPDKIQRASQFLRGTNIASMYCSRLNIVNEKLQPLGLSPNFKRRPKFRNAICENIATGCTIAINRAALDKICKIPWDKFSSKQVSYHDWWIYLVISRYGKVHFDPNPSIAYRQHGKNSIGMGAGFNRYITIWRAIQKTSWTAILIQQLRFFCLVYESNLEPKELRALQKLSNGPSWSIAMHLITSRHLQRQSVGGSIIFRFLVLYDWLRNRIP